MVTIFFFFLMLFVGLACAYRLRRYEVADIALLNVIIKTALCTVGLYVVLPFGGADAQTFERMAWQWSEGTLLDSIRTVNVSGSYVISSLTAVLYNVMGRHLAIPVYINGMLGLLIFYYSVVLFRVVWPDVPVRRVYVLVVAMSPMLNINSAVMLRENYITLFVVLAAVHLARYARSGSQISIFKFLFFVLIAAFFHGGIILFSLGLPLFIVFHGKGISVSKRVATGVFSLVAFASVMTVMDFGKLSSVQAEGLSVEYLAEMEASRSEAGSAYLVGMAPSGVHDIIWQAPIRSLYLLTKPFPWDVKNLGHFIVLLDAILWWVILLLLWKYRASIKENPSAFALFLACAVTIVAFAYGTGNFGTGVRHRTKFIVLALVLVSPFLPRFKGRASYMINGSR